MAIEKVANKKETVGILSTGLVLYYGKETNHYYYNLSKPFSDQSEELYLFLLDILTNH
jgi:hypothetical protein